MLGAGFLIWRQIPEVDLNMEADSGGSFHIEAVSEADFNMEGIPGADLFIEADFGCVWFVRWIVKGCQGRLFNMEADVGVRFPYGGRFRR
jgi:hypothetical protein